MRALESWVVDYVLNSIWQVPLVFAAAWLAARLVRPAGSRIEHRVWVAALLIQAALPVCHFRIGEAWNEVRAAMWAFIESRFGQAGGAGEARVVVGTPIALGAGFLQLPAFALAVIGVAYAGTLLYFSGRLVWGLWKTRVMLREAQPLEPGSEAGMLVARQLAAFSQAGEGSSTRAEVEVMISAAISGPVAAGIRRRILLLPAGFLESVNEGDLAAVLAHEVAHIERRDFGKNLFYVIVSLPVIFHPVLWLVTARLAETREMVCDEIAARAIAGRERYARSLLRLASMLAGPMPARTLHAIGIFDANSFERRVINMTKTRPEIRGAQRIALVAVCCALVLGACASALALRIDFSAPVAVGDGPGRTHIDVKDLKIVSKVPPVYPLKAKQDKNTINGSVILTVIVGKDGEVEHIDVKKSLRDDYDMSALDAVRQWKYEPYLVNGEAVEVETEVSITYSLAK
jgi:TonB family protein